MEASDSGVEASARKEEENVASASSEQLDASPQQLPSTQERSLDRLASEAKTGSLALLDGKDEGGEGGETMEDAAIPSRPGKVSASQDLTLSVVVSDALESSVAPSTLFPKTRKNGSSERKSRSSVSFSFPPDGTNPGREVLAARREPALAASWKPSVSTTNRTEISTSASLSGPGLWQQVLQEARLKNAIPRKSFIVLLGGEDVGKSSLVRQLQLLGSASPLSAVELHENTGGVSPLDFAFLGARKILDEEDVKTADVETTTQVWMLQRPEDWELVPPRLQPLQQGKQLLPGLFLITLDLKRAASLLRHLQTWRRVAEKISDKLLQSLDIKQQEELAEKQKRYLKNYRRQTISHLTSRAQTESFLQPTEEETETEAERVSLSFPVVVCVTRSDVSSEVGTKSSPQALEILHAFLRRECLKLGAALVFTSCKDSEKEEAILDDARRLFLPAGWDSLSELESLVKETPAGDFEAGMPVSAKVSVQSTHAFLQQLQQQHPTATVSGSNASEPLSALAVKGTAEVVAATLKKREFSAGPLRQSSLLGAAAATLLPATSSLAASSRSLERPPSAGRETQTFGSSVTSASKADGLPESGGGDQESLQNFFQGLMMKTRGKAVPATPRDRVRVAPKPKAGVPVSGPPPPASSS